MAMALRSAHLQSSQQQEPRNKKKFKIHILSEDLAGIWEGMEVNRGKRSSRISSGLSLLLDNFQSSFAQDRQVRASTDEDKDDKEKEEGA